MASVINVIFRVVLKYETFRKRFYLVLTLHVQEILPAWYKTGHHQDISIQSRSTACMTRATITQFCNISSTILPGNLVCFPLSTKQYNRKYETFWKTSNFNFNCMRPRGTILTLIDSENYLRKQRKDHPKHQMNVFLIN